MPGYNTNPYYQTPTGMNFNQMPQTAVPLPQSQQTPGSIMTIFVSSEDEVKNYPVAAGNTVLLMDFDSNQFWLKSTAQNGSPMPMRYFSFVENTPKVETPDANNQFVTKKELDDLKAYLGNQFQGIKSQLNSIRKPENGGNK